MESEKRARFALRMTIRYNDAYYDAPVEIWLRMSAGFGAATARTRAKPARVTHALSITDALGAGKKTRDTVAEHPERWRILRERLIYEHQPWLTLREQDVELPNGLVIERYILTDSPDIVMMFAITEGHQALFVEQYKHGIGRLSLDLSAGYMDAGDPSPLSAAQRELHEETGYVSEHWAHLASLASEPNRSSVRFHYFLAWDCRPAGAPHLDATEDLRVHLIPLEEVEDLAFNGRVGTVSTAAGIALGLRYWRKLMGR